MNIGYCKVISIFALLLFISPRILSVAVSAKEVKNATITIDKSYTDWLNDTIKGDALKVNMTVDNPLDVIILTKDNYWNAWMGHCAKYYCALSPVFEIRNATNSTFSWTVPDDQPYVLVFRYPQIDNFGKVIHLSYYRNDISSKSTRNAVIVVVIVIIVIMVAVIYLVVRKRKTKERSKFSR